MVAIVLLTYFNSVCVWLQDAARIATGLLDRVDTALVAEASKPTEDEAFQIALKRLQDPKHAGETEEDNVEFTEDDLYRDD